ncbi:hypothetical protein [Solitalea canadensis]|uniref:Uncharacterized protein n=1 Tax=Solitalea canadensis (strain ATCC 29591 / DSM 3403 / JCM 21819 / LMG 8368 / NBRC 15130 / NCIMB 12057 / USAM 9D) TaxID=929556 RepID=H8KML5_SOLCM|nr:hypothetical protein [Solitalea canadensis]AFD09006.1 hypothetical protein Solca_4013 [Solitalea canadensis DSM 3403]
MSRRLRKLIVVSGLIVITGAIAGLFWYNEWVYSLPTPIPPNYQPVKTGEFVYLDESFKVYQRKFLPLIHRPNKGPKRIVCLRNL